MGSKEKQINNNNMNTEQYYTPTIEDFRIGYECEWNNTNEDDVWRNTVLDLEGVYHAIQDTQQMLPTKYKVPFITKEQIKAEGWENLDGSTLWFRKGEYDLYIDNLEHIIEVYCNQQDDIVIYCGGCPSINEFRFIIKLLGIEEQ